ncbi:hypothetical protein FRB98_002779 [Tulasnella sp. 332]|nr:hypothetical protein FRB98_002779 [Tulasnella sp. 332]
MDDGTQLDTIYPQSRAEQEPAVVVEDTGRIDAKGLWSLGAQHALSTWGDRTAEFAFYLYLIELFQTTLLPASLYGFFTTGVAIIFAGTIGTLVDHVPKLRFVRLCIAVQKLSATVTYVCFFLIFHTRLREEAAVGEDASAPVWTLFTAITLSGCLLKLSTIGISVAVERDWATCIAEGHDGRLTRLNTILRRIDLVSKLLAPLFVSLLTTTTSYPFSVAFLGGFGLVSMILEILWTATVYNRLSALARDQAQKDERHRLHISVASSTETSRPEHSLRARMKRASQAIRSFMRTQASDWREFTISPVFPSSLAISLLYLTVLSFDGTLISYLKTHNFQDAFIAGMRGICVATGLFGTFIMPAMEKRLGLVRAGSWAIWGELISLIPVLLSFFIGASHAGMRGPAWNQALLFGGMAVSRIWLWAFDLCQLKELQTTLADHPRRNSITSLQFALQNVADLLKYILTIILSRPSQFRYAAVVSVASVFAGALSYTAFVKRTRGHVVHLEWMEHLLGKYKPT